MVFFVVMKSLYTLFRDGGWSMFAVVGFGLIALATAAFYAWRPDGKHEGFVKWMARATLWSILAGMCSDFATVFRVLVEIEDANRRTQIMFEGSAESLSPGIMGFVLLSLTALLTAVGRRRLDARKA
jgi:drug/metabolite transporter (DMT)-like permease